MISLSLLLCCLFCLPFSCSAQDCLNHPTYRAPTNSDITVKCGSQMVELTILLCPVYFSGYNESTMVLNGQQRSFLCPWFADWSVDPPVLKYNLSIADITSCGGTSMIKEEVGSGIFSEYSKVEYIYLTGIITSTDFIDGAISYKQELKYIYSCQYPLQYMINNTQMSVTGVSVAVKDKNGSFISTLSIQLYENRNYANKLIIPTSGLQLKKRIFVEVKATNLTDRFNVLLDRCFASTQSIPLNSSYYDLFVGCSKDGQTVIEINGLQQVARFSFEAFRFVEHRNLTVSTFYLHCITRLCEKSACSLFRQNCTAKRRRREVDLAQTGTDKTTVSSGPIYTMVESAIPASVSSKAAPEVELNRIATGLGIVVFILTAICIALPVFMFLYNRRPGKKA
ncbi:zona pellucida-like domain-containing protein 1 [Polypterus senegalus]|uniref:zona pellucida-like domain-containing protein 1 n=1 Tax=Polypterus senegalus TaxID=55291 RepID=UPI0019659432|nr:zona pellucida-like domain-containing protein 1 [Polypterus senegalus]